MTSTSRKSMNSSSATYKTQTNSSSNTPSTFWQQNSTKISYSMIHFKDLSSVEFTILAIVMLKSFNGKETELKIKYLENLTRLSDRPIKNALKGLISKGLIQRTRPTFYRINPGHQDLHEFKSFVFIPNSFLINKELSASQIRLVCYIALKQRFGVQAISASKIAFDLSASPRSIKSNLKDLIDKGFIGRIKSPLKREFIYFVKAFAVHGGVVYNDDFISQIESGEYSFGKKIRPKSTSLSPAMCAKSTPAMCAKSTLPPPVMCAKSTDNKEMFLNKEIENTTDAKGVGVVSFVLEDRKPGDDMRGSYCLIPMLEGEQRMNMKLILALKRVNFAFHASVKEKYPVEVIKSALNALEKKLEVECVSNPANYLMTTLEGKEREVKNSPLDWTKVREQYRVYENTGKLPSMDYFAMAALAFYQIGEFDKISGPNGPKIRDSRLNKIYAELRPKIEAFNALKVPDELMKKIPRDCYELFKNPYARFCLMQAIERYEQNEDKREALGLFVLCFIDQNLLKLKKMLCNESKKEGPEEKLIFVGPKARESRDPLIQGRVSSRGIASILGNDLKGHYDS